MSATTGAMGHIGVPRRRPRSRARRPRRGFLPVVLVALVALGVVPAVPASGEEPDPGAPFAITEAPDLVWGFKQSWRIYVGSPEVSRGAIELPGSGANPYDLVWPFVSGTYDPATGTTELRYEGTVHWSKYHSTSAAAGTPPPGYTGSLDVHILDVSLSDPVVRIGPDGAAVSVEARSRQRDTWELLDTGRVDAVRLDIAGVAPTVTDTTTTWTDIPAVTTTDTDPVFADSYQAGLAVDPVSFSYTGPGGAPDLSEHWTPAGSVLMEQTGSTIVTENGSVNSSYAMWWLDRENLVAHYWVVVGGVREYRAVDLATLQVGEPWIPTASTQRPTVPRFVDTNTDRAFYTVSGAPTELRWFRYDKEARRYVHGVAPGAVPPASSWDPVGQRAISIRKVTPPGVAGTAYDEHHWEVVVSTEQGDGSWAQTAHRLPNAPVGLNRFAYPTTLVSATAADGSIVIAGRTLTSHLPEVPDPATVPAVLRLTIEGGEAHIAPVPGTDAPNDAFFGTYEAIHPGPDGQLVLTRASHGRYLVLHTAPDGEITVDPVVTLPDLGLEAFSTDSMAVDPTDGTVWLAGYQSQRLAAIRDGELVTYQFFSEMHPRNRMVAVGPDHDVYTWSSDGEPPGFGGNPVFGYARFDRVAVSPTLTASPAPASVALGVGVASAPASFEAAATAEPAPAVRWQARPAGAVQFTDLPGADTATLTVDATPDHDGTEYRAVFTNAAGAIATDPARLTVEYAPSIAIPPASLTAPRGTDAELAVAFGGNPEPVVTWEYETGDLWVAVGPELDGVEPDGGFLRIRDADPALSGTRFRARLSNSVATITTDPVTLTVESSDPGPGQGEQEVVVEVPDLGPGELVWTISGDGTPVALSEAADAGDHWAFGGEIHPIVVNDTREGAQPWSISGQVGDFTEGLDGKHLGWSPKLVSAGGGAAAGSPVPSGFVGGDGLKSPSLLASAGSGHGSGSATVGADLDLRVPIATDPGTYTATLTITALS